MDGSIPLGYEFVTLCQEDRTIEEALCSGYALSWNEANVTPRTFFMERNPAVMLGLLYPQHGLVTDKRKNGFEKQKSRDAPSDRRAGASSARRSLTNSTEHEGWLARGEGPYQDWMEARNSHSTEDKPNHP